MRQMHGLSPVSIWMMKKKKADRAHFFFFLKNRFPLYDVVSFGGPFSFPRAVPHYPLLALHVHFFFNL